MTPEEYKRAGELFHQLREMPERERREALDAACETDSDLRAHIGLLLEGDREAAKGSFLERHAIEDAARLLAPEAGNLPPSGTVVGHYRLNARIGAGGMGVVYEAEDLHLPRRVAVKVLPIPFAAQSQQRIQRFQREARAASQLNHPHIVSIFDAGFDQGCYYIAMEFVEGRTLRALMAADARFIDSKTVLEIVSQTASALSAAHQAGIVHRDIKPENIMVRGDGFVKVLDFGLATMLEPASSSRGESELRTRPGHLAGTIQYLSPEQVLGKPAGARSDLFSLGVVAYELATGVRPFEGPTDGAIFDAILHRDPEPPSAVRPSLGTELDSLVTCALEKDPDLRYQTAADLRSACKRLGRTSTPAATIPVPQISTRGSAGRGISVRPARDRQFPWRIGLPILAIALSGTLFWLTRPLPMPRVVGIARITSDGLPKEYFVNDGTRLYYAAGNGNAELKMFQVSTRGGDPVPMPQLDGMVPLDISADDSEMLLGQRSVESGAPLALWAAATVGGPPRRLGDLTAVDARWSPKGDEILYCDQAELRMARSDGSESRLLARTKSDELRYPAWSPDGRKIRFTLYRKNVVGLWEVWADGSHLHQLFSELGDYPREDGVWTHNGKYFLFSAEEATHDLWAVRERSRFFIRSGSSVLRLTNGPLIADRPQPSPDDRSVFFRGQLNRGELVRYDAKADQWNPYLQGLPAMQLDYTRDGKWITYAYTSYPETYIWRCAADGSDRMQLTTTPLHAMNPRWSPDGTQIVFYGGPPGKPSRLYLVPARGGAVREVTHGEAGPGGDEDGSWSPDGASLVFGPQGGDKLPNQPQYLPLAVINLKTGRVSKLPGSEGLWSPRWSPDGRYVAALGLPQPTLWLYDLATHERRQLTTTGASWPSWSPDSHYIQFSNNGWFRRIRISDGKVERLASLNGLKTADGSFGWIGVAPDGSLISTRDAGSTEIYALDWKAP